MGLVRALVGASVFALCGSFEYRVDLEWDSKMSGLYARLFEDDDAGHGDLAQAPVVGMGMGRQLTYSYAPVLNVSTSRFGRMNYTYFSPPPFSFRESHNPWVVLGSDLSLYDASSTHLAGAYFFFDDESYDGDALLYPSAVDGIEGSFDDGSLCLVLKADPAMPKASWLNALRSVLYKAKESLTVKDRPNVHQRLVWISLEDAEGNRGDVFGINITLSTASTIITDRSGVTLRDKA